MAGDRETGVTDPPAELDAGPVGAQRALSIEPATTAGGCLCEGGSLAAELSKKRSPEPSFTPQAPEGVTYAEGSSPADRELDWSARPTSSSNRIRALSPHIGARGQVEGAADGLARRCRRPERLTAGGLELLEVRPKAARRMYDGAVAARRYRPEIIRGWPGTSWTRTVEVEPSLYAADFARLGEQIETLVERAQRSSSSTSATATSSSRSRSGRSCSSRSRRSCTSAAASSTAT